VVVVNLSNAETEFAPGETLEPWQIRVGGRES
jgi:hypothetical protein